MRCTSYLMVIALAFGSLCIYMVSANAIFELKLQKFQNKLGLLADGHCCSGVGDSRGRCSDVCKTKFRVCLKVYQTKIDPEGPCTFGEYYTPVLGDNELDLVAGHQNGGEVGFVNPVRFKLESWPKTFSLIVEALHENPPNGSDKDAVLISRLMTQRHLGVGADWTQEIYRTSTAALFYQFRAVCQDNYYGEGCRKLCRPRDDNFGHYTCNETGDSVCLPGWKEPEVYCVKPVCKPGCNLDNGYCESPNECKCHTGWEGETCNQCILYPGCLHGTCKKPWECTCNEGWGGLFCNEDLNYCTNHKPCKNGATCFNTKPGSYSCKCPPGFSGTNCEIVSGTCAVAPCQNGGTCLDTEGNGFVCQCPSGFTGQYCEISGLSCLDRPCRNGATCVDTLVGFKCTCPPGFEGKNCERPVNECVALPCMNGGSCVDMHNDFRCFCPGGFTGELCETNIDDCANHPCLNGGACVDGVDQFDCRCPLGFMGSLCQINKDDCQAHPCANGGTCIDGDNDFKCVCPPGWGGKHCTKETPRIESPCKSSPCENGGQCVEAPNVSSGYTCICPPGILGPRCTVPQEPWGDPSGEGEPLSASQIILIVTFSVAMPLLAIASALVIICMKRRRRRESNRHDEEARKQNEQNAVHNAVNAINNKCLEENMIFNSLDYPTKPLNTEHQNYLQYHQRSVTSPTHSLQEIIRDKAIENAYTIAPARSTKTLNTDVSRLSLAERLEKDLDSYRKTPVDATSYSSRPCKTPDPYVACNIAQVDVYSKRNDVHTSTNTLASSTCTPPSTCTTPSSVYVIEEHYDDNYLATEV